MARINHKGPEEEGPKTGRKLGRCKLSDSEKLKMGEMGIGEGKRRHSGGGEGNQKRLKYTETHN